MRLYSKTHSTIYEGYCGAVSHEFYWRFPYLYLTNRERINHLKARVRISLYMGLYNQQIVC